MTNSLERLQEHAEASKALADTRVNLERVRERMGEVRTAISPEEAALERVRIDTAWAEAKDAVRAAEARYAAAYKAYTNPFDVKKTV